VAPFARTAIPSIPFGNSGISRYTRRQRRAAPFPETPNGVRHLPSVGQVVDLAQQEGHLTEVAFREKRVVLERHQGS